MGIFNKITSIFRGLLATFTHDDAISKDLSTNFNGVSGDLTTRETNFLWSFNKNSGISFRVSLVGRGGGAGGFAPTSQNFDKFPMTKIFSLSISVPSTYIGIPYHQSLSPPIIWYKQINYII